MKTALLQNSLSSLIVLSAMFIAIPAVDAQSDEPLPEPFLFDGLVGPDRLPIRTIEPLRLRNEPIPAVLQPREVTQDDEPATIADRFAGNWRLVSYNRIDADGTTRPWNISGRLMYDADGNMAAQLMPLEDEGDERTRLYYAYFGTFEIDEAASTVTHHVEASNIRRWVGTVLVRHYRFEDGMLILEVRVEDRATGRLTWERVDAE